MRHPLLAFAAVAVLLTGPEPARAGEAGERSRACGAGGVQVQVLGSGGPELDDGRASSGYLIWHEGRARVLVDAGPGVAVHFDRSGADFEDLVAIVVTHVHADHVSDIPALVKGSYFEQRTTSLPIFGPSGNDRYPGFEEWMDRMIGPSGAFRYLSDFLSQGSSGGYEVVPREITASGRDRWSGFRREGVGLSAVPTDHGPVPALAWRVDVGHIGITFTGDTANRRGTVAGLADRSALLVGHHAVPEQAGDVARALHMPPSEIGRLAAEADVDRLLLSHRMNRTLGRERAALDAIREHFRGRIDFAEDMACWRP
jgi:ribonuclease BN (tRNA processing enzyme)